MSIKHAFVSAKSDSADTSLVRPSNWNADHTIQDLPPDSDNARDLGTAALRWKDIYASGTVVASFFGKTGADNAAGANVGFGTGVVNAMVGSGDTSGIGQNGIGGSLRFNGAAIAWGDLAYHPNDGHALGQFRFSTTGATISTGASNASLGVRALLTGASTASLASVRLPHGTAPTSPVDGDMWTTTGGLFVRINGATVGPLS